MQRLLVLILLAACGEPRVDTIRLGDDTFASVCARCHGRDGTGGVVAQNGVRPRDLTDPAWQSSLGDGQIEAIVLTGRGSMPGFAAALSHDKVQAVVGKVRRLKRSAP